MEPKNWKWIQGIAVVAAAAVGLAVTVWYVRRPVDTSIPVPPVVPVQKVIVRPINSYVTPSVAPRKAPSASTASASSTDATDDTGPLPSQSSVTSLPKEDLDPRVNLHLPAYGASVPPAGANGYPAAPPLGGIPADGAQGTAPSPYVPASPYAPAPPPGVPAPPSSFSPFGGTTPAAGGAATPTTSGTSGTSPFVNGSGAGPVVSGGMSTPGTPVGGAGTTPGL